MSKQSKTNLTGWHRNTDLGCDLKTILRSDRRMKVKKDYQGVLRLDDEGTIDEYLSRDPHYTFVETLKTGEGFCLDRYALGVYDEICIAIGGLVEED